MIQCLHCQATTDNGLALCDQCRASASIYLEFLPVYFANLARWRPGRAGSRPVPASREPKDFRPREGDAVERALDDAGMVLLLWAQNLHDDRDVEIPDADGEVATVAALCRMLNERLVTIATLEWCGLFVDELAEHEAALRKLTERVAPGWYAGACNLCASPTHVVPGLTWVTCDGCGSTTYARDHLDTIIDEAREWIDRPKALAEAAVALLDTESDAAKLYARIRKWESRGWLDAHRRVDRDGDPSGPKRYRFGDVLDLLARHVEARRTTAA